MRNFIKRIAGLVAAAVGATGAVLSVLAIVQAWTIADRLSREIPEVLAHLEAIADSVREQGESTVSLLETARERVASISIAVEELSKKAGERPTTASILEALEPDIEQRLESAEEVILAMQNSIRSMSSALLLLDSIPFFKPWIAPAEGQDESHLKTVATSLTETADLLGQATEAVTRVRSGQTISPQQLAQLQETLVRVDRGLGDVESEIRLFSGRVEQTGSQLTRLREEVPGWIHNSALIATGFFVCFGFSQLSLLLHGWQWLRGTPAC